MRERRSLWMLGLESEEPTYQQRVEVAGHLSEQFGVELTAPRIPKAEQLDLRPPRISPPGVADRLLPSGHMGTCVSLLRL